jgi:DeoR family transcriptional regulator, aga operon transcriptional repressor
MTDTTRPRRPRREQRLERILSLLSTEGAVDVAAIAEELQVSTASIRRDLEVLEERHLLMRTHGGAVAQGVTYELPIRYRSGQCLVEKRAIAAEAAGRVPEGRCVIGLTGGTTTTQVARCLLDHPGLTVVTNALNIASDLVVRTNVRLVVIGGVARTESYELVGPIAEATVKLMNIDIAFLGVDGVSPDAGFTTHQEMEAHTNAALLVRSRRVVAVADSTKLGKVAFAPICGLADVDELITDSGADRELVDRLRDSGLRVTTVPPTN